jgi:hypothetical protein
MTTTAPSRTLEHGVRHAAPSFEPLLPSIHRCANYAFRHLPRARRQELVDEVIANAYVGFARLIARRLEALIYPTALANFAIRQVRAGRRVGCRQNVRDVLSPDSQARQRVSLERLDQQDAQGQWHQRLIADGRATPAELAACRLDFSAWLARLRPRQRQVALRLAAGDTTNEAARHFRLSAARLSQFRRELEADWNAFQGLLGAN